MRSLFIVISLLFANQTPAQPTHNLPDSGKQQYLAALKLAGKTFSSDFYPNYAAVYSLPEKSFIPKIESARKKFNLVLNNYKSQLTAEYIQCQKTEIKYYFDKLLIDYPLNHDIYVGQTSKKSSAIPAKLSNNLADFNKKALLANSDFTSYVRAFFAYRVNLELKKPSYKHTDNQQLNAVWKLIRQFIYDPVCREFWQCDYLFNHIDNNGIKNITPIYNDFKATCKDTAYLVKVHSIYAEDSTGRQGHLIRTYKTVDNFELDMHLFLPDNIMAGTKKQVIIYFHGGSWSEGKPDWFFNACENYAKKGWIACAAEYRTYGRQGTLPFAAVMDAKSAIRWLRQHAAEYNIDSNKIVASGNSAGGHLVLCAALADKWNEKTDNLAYSSAPDLIMVNSAVYDLTDQNTTWIRKDLKNKNAAREISPVYLLKKNFPPALLIHGTNDRNVPYLTAQKFVAGIAGLRNTTTEFQSLRGAGHFIWYDPEYAPKVSALRLEFLAKWGF